MKNKLLGKENKNKNKSMILCSHAYSTLEGLSVLRFLHYGASLFSDLADCITLKQWKLCCMGWPRSPSKKDLLSSCWGMQSLYSLQLSVHSGIIWVALPKITSLPWWFKGMLCLAPRWPSSFILSDALNNCPPLFPSSILDTFWPGGGGLIFWCHIFLPFYTAHGLLMARIREWFSISSSSVLKS